MSNSPLPDGEWRDCLERITAIPGDADIRPDLSRTACTQGWDMVFDPKWDFLAQHSVLPVAELCAISVGMHPTFADRQWIANVALLFLQSGCPHMKSELWRGESLIQVQRFLQRESTAQAALAAGELAQAGTKDDGHLLVRVTDFVLGQNQETLRGTYPLIFPGMPRQKCGKYQSYRKPHHRSSQ